MSHGDDVWALSCALPDYFYSYVIDVCIHCTYDVDDYSYSYSQRSYVHMHSPAYDMIRVEYSIG